MAAITAFVLLGAILLCAVVAMINKMIDHHRLKHFSGPPLAKLFRLWLLKTHMSGEMHLRFYEAAKKYGKHNEVRAKVAMGFSGKENPHWESKIDNILSSMVEVIDKKYATSDSYIPMDWASMAAHFTLDVITSVGFSHCLDNVKQDRDVWNYIDSINPGMPVVQTLTVYPSLVKILERLPFQDKIFPTAQNEYMFGKWLRFARDTATERLQMNAELLPNDILTSFIKHGLSHDELKANIIVAINAATDPVATALSTAIIFTASNPKAHGALVSELASKNLLTASPSEIVPMKTLRGLPYLQCLIKEVLRVHPPFIGLTSKTVPDGGDYLDGRFVPGGTQIGFNFWAAIRDTGVFGDDADVLKPERWLQADEEKRNRMERSFECIFSLGRFTCLGKDLAIMELSKVLVEFFRRFDATVVNPLKPWDCQAMGIFLQKNAWLEVTRRQVKTV